MKHSHNELTGSSAINTFLTFRLFVTMASPMSKERYRLEQEAFVSNHGGTPAQEVAFMLMPNLCSMLLASTTVGVLRKYIHTCANVTVAIEFMLSVIPSILFCTVLSEHVRSVCSVMISIIMLNVMVLLGSRGTTLFNLTEAMRPATGKRPFVTNFRALTNIIATICILAVDFQIFPRKFAKTETFGYSLMDTGVGLFILANALVAPEARDFSSHRQARFRKTLIKNMKNCFRGCAFLLILGFGRSIAVEYSGYQKHVTEYGVHWNFFLTLAAVKLFTSMITSAIKSKYSLFSGIWILGMHEYIMSVKGLKQWLVSDGPRDDFFSANREGLISVPGYIGLYFLGIAVGRLIHSTYENSPAKSNMSLSVKLFGLEFQVAYNESILLFFKLLFISAQACIATIVCNSHFEISRRFANAAYCMWILTLTTMVLSFLLILEIKLDIINYAASGTNNENKMMKQRKNLRLNLKKCEENEKEENKEYVIRRSLEIFEAVNYNGLFFFLLSNIMTGLINILVHTLYVQKSVALLILIVYMAVNIFSTLILYRLQIQIKL